MLIVVGLADGPLRFFELRNRIEGISEKMLSQISQTLCADGLIDRTVDASIPPRVTYSLTTLGTGLQEELYRVVTWITRHADAIADAQRRHANSIGHAVKT